MTTYEVKCGYCNVPILQEHAAPLDDPGTLKAFCQDFCSEAFFRNQVAGLVELGARLVKMPCGCLVLVESTVGPGATMPWPMCEEYMKDWPDHGNQIHADAVEQVRKELAAGGN